MAVVSVSLETDTTATNRELPAHRQDGTRIVPDATVVVAASCRVRLPFSDPLAWFSKPGRTASTFTHQFDLIVQPLHGMRDMLQAHGEILPSAE